MTGGSINIDSHKDPISREYFHHSSAPRVNTDAVLVEALRQQYPHLKLVVAPAGRLQLLQYAAAGFATAVPLEDSKNDPVYGAALSWRVYSPPQRRLDDRPGVLTERILFGKYAYKWKDHEFLMYYANGRDGNSPWPEISNHYILSRNDHLVNELITEATTWAYELHDEVWVFDQFWQKSRELWESVQKSTWDNVILEEGMKKAIISDVENFFDNRDAYQKLKVPWKVTCLTCFHDEVH